MEFGISDLQPEADTLFISYGTTARAMREAVDRGREAGQPVSGLTLHTLWPVPENLILDAVAGHRRIIVAELNHGQYIREIERLVYRDAAQKRILPPEIIGLDRADGELITPEQFLGMVNG